MAAADRPVRPTPISQVEDSSAHPYFGWAGPKAYCSEQEKAYTIKFGEANVRDADYSANKTRDYLASMRQRVEAERKAFDEANYKADSNELAAFTANDLELMTVTDPRRAEDALEQIKKTPVVDCLGSTPVETQRPADPPIEIPATPDKLCSDAEKKDLLEKIEKLDKKIETAYDDWYKYRASIDKQQKFYIYFVSNSNIDPDKSKKILESLRKEAEFADAKTKEINERQVKLEKVRLAVVELIPIDCTTPEHEVDQPTLPPTEAPGGAEAKSFKVPMRPLLVPPIEPPARKTCTEDERAALLANYDMAIKFAKAQAEAMNKHLDDLRKLFKEANVANAPANDIKALGDEIDSYQLQTSLSSGLAGYLEKKREEVFKRPLDKCLVEKLQQAPGGGGAAHDKVGCVPDNRDMMAVLDLHNQVRSKVGAAPLRWNVELAQEAQDRADILAQSGQLLHDSPVARHSAGENLVVGARSGLPPVSMAGIWTNESQNFTPGVFPNVCSSGDWRQCGHYSQMIDSKSTDLGCGYAKNKYNALVCRYTPPGNMWGQPVLGVPPNNIAQGPVINVNNPPLVNTTACEAPKTLLDTGKSEKPAPAAYQWIDVKTGKPVPTAPLSGRNLGGGDGAGVAQMEGFDPNATHAFNPKTGQNFAKVPVGMTANGDALSPK